MTIHLTADTEARVRSIAEQRGQNPEEAFSALLNHALAEAEAEMLTELRASVEDHEAGRSMTNEEYREKALARRRARDARLPSQTPLWQSWPHERGRRAADCSCRALLLAGSGLD